MDKSAEGKKRGDEALFQQLFGQTEPVALHAALHSLSPNKFKHGTYAEDHTAAEAIHHDDPALGTSIAMLARRQNSDSSNSSSSAPPSPTPTSAESVTSSHVDGPDSSVLSSLSDATFPSSNIPTAGSTPVSPSPSPSPATSVVTVTPSRTIVVVTSTSFPPQQSSPAPGTSHGSSPSPSPSPSPSVSQSQPSPRTTDAGSAPSTSVEVVVPSLSAGASSPAGISSSAAAGASIEGSATTSGSGSGGGGAQGATSVFLETVSLSNGQLSTFLATSFVGSDVTATLTGSASGGAAETTPGGSLQSEGAAAHGANAWEWEALGVIGGAVGVFVAL